MSFLAFYCEYVDNAYNNVPSSFKGNLSPNLPPVRNPFDTWYISREVWPYDTYPLWLQGMVYLLSPSNTADLFQAALRTHYMHTDDVFIGILVNKTAKPGQKSLIINDLSA